MSGKKGPKEKETEDLEQMRTAGRQGEERERYFGPMG